MLRNIFSFNKTVLRYKFSDIERKTLLIILKLKYLLSVLLKITNHKYVHECKKNPTFIFIINEIVSLYQIFFTQN